MTHGRRPRSASGRNRRDWSPTANQGPFARRNFAVQVVVADDLPAVKLERDDCPYCLASSHDGCTGRTTVPSPSDEGEWEQRICSCWADGHPPQIGELQFLAP